MKEEKLKIRIGKQQIVTLPELYQQYEQTHRSQAGLPFEGKIKILVDLQKLAVSWGNRRDIIVWKV